MPIMPNESMLVMPSATHARSYQSAVAEGYPPDPAAPPLDGGPGALDAHIAWLNAQGDQIRLPDGRTVATAAACAALDDARLYLHRPGEHPLPSHARAGAVGRPYRLCHPPSFRRRGFGTHLLSLAIPTARASGLGGLLLTCLEDNIGSIRVIEANGGALIGVGPHPYQPDQTARRYWIEE